MKRLFAGKTSLILCFIFISCNGQKIETPSIGKHEIVGGGCDGCVLMYIDMPQKIGSTSTSPGWNEKGQKLIVSGTVFQFDGKTPAPGVIIYYWQTDNDGYYSPKPGMDERAKRHGHIRGWVETDISGKYTIKTIRPAPYPNQTMPAHIHLSIKEPGITNEYYIDEINFNDDKFLIAHFKKHPQENRGGSGVVSVLLKDSLQIGEHNIILGLNIPDYPKKIPAGKQSGLNIGEDQPSFIPFHAYGPDKGTQACPVCKYGRYDGIIYFVGNHPDWNEIKKWLRFLELESIKRQAYLKVYFVYGDERSYNKEERREQLEQLGNELNLNKTALTFAPSFTDKETEADVNKINPDVRNTFIVFRHRNIVDKYIDLLPTAENFNLLTKTLYKTQKDYFELLELKHN